MINRIKLWVAFQLLALSALICPSKAIVALSEMFEEIGYIDKMKGLKK